MFLGFLYIDITKHIYIRIWKFTEIQTRERCGLFAFPRTVSGKHNVLLEPLGRFSWNYYNCFSLNVFSLWNSRSKWPRGLRRLPESDSFLGFLFRTPPAAWVSSLLWVMCVCLLWVMCVWKRSLRVADHPSRTVRGMPESDREAPTARRSWPTWDCNAWGMGEILIAC
jgi:hypothetical protein